MQNTTNLAEALYINIQIEIAFQKEDSALSIPGYFSWCKLPQCGHLAKHCKS